MDIRRVVARNVFSNWAGTGLLMLSGFVLAPFLVRHLGETNYGLWIVVGALTGYFGLLDLGVRNSVGRYVAFHLAKSDYDGLNAILSTALAILCVPAVLTVLATLIVSLVFFNFFTVPADEVAGTRLALLLVGVTLALTFPLSVFEAILWGYQRFDLQNAIQIPTVLLQTGLTLWLIGRGDGLVALGLINLLVTVLNRGVTAAVGLRLDRALKLSPGHVRREAARRLFGYGCWSFLLCLSRMITAQLGSLLIGSWLAVQLVTPYSIATRLIGYASGLLIMTTGVLTPVATTFHAQRKQPEQQRLFLDGGKYCTAFSLFVLAAFLFLGKPFIGLWMGPELAYASSLLVILAVGEVLPMSQWITTMMLLGKDRHRVLAYFYLADNAVAVLIALAVIKDYGLMGVCVAFAVPAFLFRGVAQIAYGCRLLDVSPWTYAFHALVRPVAAAALPAAGLALLTQWKSPESWAELVLSGVLFGSCYVVSWALLEERERLFPRLAALVARPKNATAPCSGSRVAASLTRPPEADAAPARLAERTSV